MDIYKRAAFAGLLFDTVAGKRTVSQMTEMNLTSSKHSKTPGYDLDTVGQAYRGKLAETSGGSLVDDSVSVGDPMDQLRFDIIVDIIATKKAENATKTQAVAEKSEAARELEVLMQAAEAEKHQKALGLSPTKRDARIKELQAKL